MNTAISFKAVYWQNRFCLLHKMLLLRTKPWIFLSEHDLHKTPLDTKIIVITISVFFVK